MRGIRWENLNTFWWPAVIIAMVAGVLVTLVVPALGIPVLLAVFGGLLYLVVRPVDQPVGVATPSRAIRPIIPQSVRHAVWRRDQGRCVECGSNERLEYDHIIPLSRGGSNTERNLRLLCEGCNRRKGATI
jgi:hypothetical protein